VVDDFPVCVDGDQEPVLPDMVFRENLPQAFGRKVADQAAVACGKIGNCRAERSRWRIVFVSVPRRYEGACAGLSD
jgi:hypothetical protein